MSDIEHDAPAADPIGDVDPEIITPVADGLADARAAILERIGDEEIPHVAAGVRWFDFLCERRGLDPATAFQELIRSRFKGQIKGPFNQDARAQAGFPERYYLPLAA